MNVRDHIQWFSYPALVASVLLGGGIVAASAAPAGPFPVWAFIAVLAVFAYGVAARHGERHLVSMAPLVQTLAAGLLIFAVGGARYALFEARPPHHVHFVVSSPSWDTEGDATVEGRVAGPVHRTSTRTRFDIDAEQIDAEQVGSRIDYNDGRSITGRVRVTVNTRARTQQSGPDALTGLTPGARVRITGRLRPPPTRRNPADFDYGAYLRRQGMAATLYVPNDTLVHVTHAAPPGLSSLVSAVRVHVRRVIQEHTPTAASSAVLQALLLGDRHQVGRSTREAFAATGLMHLLAVSGLHVLLVGMVFYQLLRPALLRLGLRWRRMEWTRTVATVTLLALYMLLTGSGASVVRAVVMAALFMGSTLAQRSTRTLNTLGVAGIVLLLLRPTALFDVGFQLSFAAVAAIVTLNPVLQRAFPVAWTNPAIGKAGTSNVTVSVAATLGTLPVLLTHFGYVSFAGLALNLVAIPCTTLAMSAGLMMVLTGGVLPAAAAAFGATADALVHVLLWTARLGAEHLAWASFDGFVSDVWLLLSLCFGMGVIAQWKRPRYRWRLVIALLTCLLVSVATAVVASVGKQPMEIVFLDVGHGDAALIRFPNGGHLLVDAGGRNPYVDYGERTILPHLKRYGVRELDAVVVTHADADHLGGLPTLLRNIPVRRVLHNGWPADTKLYKEALHLIDSLSVRSETVMAGDTLHLDPSVRIQVLGPPVQEVVDRAGFTENDASVVLRIEHGRNRMLFMGDAEERAEAWLARSIPDLLESTLIKVGHHGSSTSSTPSFVERVLPEPSRHTQAVVSASRWNMYGLPHRDAIQRWTSRGAAVLETGQEGALWFRSDGTSIERVDWR